MAVLAIVGCGAPSLPTAPSELTAGIVIYEDIDFQGVSGYVDRDLNDLSVFKGPCTGVEEEELPPSSYTIPGGARVPGWNDCISSVRVAPGWSATLYRSKDYGRDFIEITADMPDLRAATARCPNGGLNDCVTSIRVRRRPVR